ncbi:hypothetical protein FCV58_18795 [Vibrio sp. F13]|nr:hypothetical protein FCV57_13160 [Vibrio sp. F13]TKF43090.1 hypothetical protein FCV49_14710 [Vibrio sp. F13]TKF62492.1 hypothetical protein FCV58_18795 [Vibrio sp. F13]TKF77180.1 hypothetical protein FCV59_01655 [Vibrio sp. F13]TKG06421.1 hypothetical protein FCV67_14885 [Vibrio sp. F13]
MPITKDTKEKFIQKAIQRWGERYDYSLVEYVNSRTAVTIICPVHQYRFTQTPKAHFAAKHHCCPICYKEVRGSYQNRWRLSSESKSPLRMKLPSQINQVFRF